MKILIVEDDNDLREITTHSLEKERYVVSQAPDYRTALQKIEDYDYDCILLDIMLPDGNGLDLLAELHALGKHTNVIILSAKDSLEDKVNGLDLGADDYLTKPFNPLEVLARVRSLLRRSYEFNVENVEKNELITVGELTLDEDSKTISKNGENLIFTPTEYKILALLMKKPGRVFTKAQIFEDINGEYYQSDDNSLMVHIYRIREKIEEDSKNPIYVKTVRGLGYKIEKM